MLSADAGALRREGLSDGVIGALKIAEASALRLLETRVEGRPILSSWDALGDYLQAAMAHSPVEEVRILFLNARNLLLANEAMWRGSVDEAPVHVREVIGRAIQLGATAIIIVHNHPSVSESEARALGRPAASATPAPVAKTVGGCEVAHCESQSSAKLQSEISEPMRIEGDYKKDGYATVRGLIPPEVASNLFKQLQVDLAAAGKSFETFAKLHDLSRHQTSDISGHFYRPLTTFLWGLTPIMIELTGADLLPSYDYFRIYQKDDICRVHADRPSCEHSVSLTIAYSDGVPWPLQVGSERVTSEDPCVEDFGDEPFTAIEMQPGDAVLYRGMDLRHGRTQPNPNRWSAHLFLFWVERGGKFAQHAFDEERLRSELRRVSKLTV